MTSRMSETSNGSLVPSRRIVTVTFVPFGPRIFLTASGRLMSLVASPSIFTIRSPGWMPARHAGVPSIGATTVSTSSRIVISIPRPPKLPEVSTCISR